MNEHEAERIAAAMHALRPDWPVSSLLTLIRKKLIDRPRRDVTVALAWVACEAGTATPARVLESGPWWRAAGVEGAASQLTPFDANSFCTVCGRLEQVCRTRPGDHDFESVAARRHKVADAGLDVHRIVVDLKERLGAERPVPEDRPAPTPDPRAEAARAGLRDTPPTAPSEPSRVAAFIEEEA